MTQEDKELLLKDLCGRLPYGVIVSYKLIKDRKIQYIEPLYNRVKLIDDSPSGTVGIEDIIPYLRPISSMTTEERKEFEDIIGFKAWSDDFDNQFDFLSDEYAYIDKECVIKTYNWLNANHFDYRDLISRGLAIEAKGRNNPYKV